jgi:DNA-binding IclR family transcriptional regulator
MARAAARFQATASYHAPLYGADRVTESTNDGDEDSGGNGRGTIQAVDGALIVLQVLASLTGPAPLGEIARLASMSPSKVHRYLASFIKAGLVQQTHRSGRYDLGRAALELGLAAMSRLDLVSAAADRLEDLVEATGAAGLLAVWGNQGPTVVRWHRTRSFVITSLGLGTTMPLLNSATGRVFLAFSPWPVVEPLFRQELERAQALGLRWADINPASDADFEALITRVRAVGYAAVDGRFVPGLNAIAAPVLNWQREAEAVMTLTTGDPSILDPNGPALRLLLAACREVSAQRPDHAPA